MSLRWRLAQFFEIRAGIGNDVEHDDGNNTKNNEYHKLLFFVGLS